MKACLLILLFIPLISCTSLRPVEMASTDLQAQISNGDLIAVGDVVKLVTANGEYIEIRVSGLNSNFIEGEGNQVPIAEIVAMESRRFSGGKTALLAGTSVGLAYLILLVGISGAFVL